MSRWRWQNPAGCIGFADPEVGDALLVITAPPPVRGFIKRQDFVEMSLLESVHGVAVRPNSDDVIGRACRRQDHRSAGPAA